MRTRTRIKTHKKKQAELYTHTSFRWPVKGAPTRRPHRRRHPWRRLRLGRPLPLEGFPATITAGDIQRKVAEADGTRVQDVEVEN